MRLPINLTFHITKLKPIRGSRPDELQSQIHAEEAKLQRVREIADEVGVILDGHKAEGSYELEAAKASHVNTINSAPMEAWWRLRLARLEGHSSPECRASWLPSDLVQEPGYKAEEDRLRGAIASAKAALGPLSADLKKIFDLTSEADSL